MTISRPHFYEVCYGDKTAWVIDWSTHATWTLTNFKKEIRLRITEEKEYLKNSKKDSVENLKEYPGGLDWHELIVVPNSIERMRALETILKKVSRKSDAKGYDLSIIKSIPIGDYVAFNSAGFAKCVWHNEATPSMHIIKKSNKAHCFGCGKSGSVIDVIMAINNVDVKEALKILSPR